MGVRRGCEGPTAWFWGLRTEDDRSEIAGLIGSM